MVSTILCLFVFDVFCSLCVHEKLSCSIVQYAIPTCPTQQAQPSPDLNDYTEAWGMKFPNHHEHPPTSSTQRARQQHPPFFKTVEVPRILVDLDNMEARVGQAECKGGFVGFSGWRWPSVEFRARTMQTMCVTTMLKGD